MLSEAVLADLLMTRPSTSPILPRIKTLNADGELAPDYPWCKFFTGLLHEGLQEISIYIDNEQSPDVILRFLEEVVWRSPNVTKLSVGSSVTTFDGDVGVSLSSSISRMHKLRMFLTYSCLLTPPELSALEQLPNLQEVSIFENSYFEERMTDEWCSATICFPQCISTIDIPDVAMFIGRVMPLLVSRKWYLTRSSSTDSRRYRQEQIRYIPKCPRQDRGRISTFGVPYNNTERGLQCVWRGCHWFGQAAFDLPKSTTPHKDAPLARV